jgi:hypothetical protein
VWEDHLARAPAIRAGSHCHEILIDLLLESDSCRGRVAQLGEHLLCKQGVTGSIPVTSTNFLFCPHCFNSGLEPEHESASLLVCPILCPPSLDIAVSTASSEG